MAQSWIRLPLRYRLALASLVPLLLIIISMAVISIETRKSDLDRNMQLMAQTRASFAARDVDVAIFSKDITSLQTIIANAMTLKATKGVIYLDINLNKITASKDFILPNMPLQSIIKQSYLQDNYFYQAQPIYLSGISFSDYSTEFDEPLKSELLGWVVVAIDVSEQRHQFQVMVISTLLVAVAGLLVALLITYYLNKSIVSPILELTKTVTQITEGDLSVRAKSYSLNEFALLADGVNRMVAAVQESKINLEAKVNDATLKLQETLADLQQKNYELEIARNQSEKASQSKSQFLARMSHELRTPITSIQGFAKLLYDSVINEIDRQHCQVIDQAASQLLLLINDILDYSKLQSNTVVLNNRPFNLIECVEQVATLFSLTAQEKSLEFIVDVAPTLTVVRLGDEKRVRQVINNLISNAIKFTNKGGVYITVAETEQLGNVRISVSDTGIGIKENHRNMLFQAFSQADTSISRQYGGTGLGLSISRNLVDLMDGAIYFYSSEGKGSDFIAEIPLPEVVSYKPPEKIHEKVLVYHSTRPSYKAINHALARIGYSATSAEKTQLKVADFPIIIHYLPPAAYLADDFPGALLETRKEAPEALFIVISPVINMHNLFSADELAQMQPVKFIASPPNSAALASALKQPREIESEAPKTLMLNDLNILIAEDNQFTCLLLETLIERSGGVFSTATNGIEAIKISHREPFDILLIDVHMPELNGIDAIKEIRNGHGANKKTPIIALTADLQQQDKDILKKAGANELMLKPFNEKQLLQVIRKLVGLKPVTAQKVEGIENLVSEQLYIDELLRLTCAIDVSLKDEDLALIREYIHQMLGITGIFTLDDLEENVKSLHLAAKSGDIKAMKTIVDHLMSLLSPPGRGESIV